MFGTLKIIELASVLAGPAVGLFFAELGAQVIKIENPATQGDVTRKWKLPSEDQQTDISSYFSAFNWGKKSVALDLQTAQGKALLYELVKQADIVIANYKPGDAEKLQMDYHTLQQYNPVLIYAHITGYGSHIQRSGFDAIIQAESGFMFLNGSADGPPTKMPVALMDILAAHFLKEALLIALLLRQSSSQGRYIEVSLYQAAIASLANQASNWLVGKQEPQRIGSEHPNIAPYGTLYQTLDRQTLVLAVGTEHQFRSLCQVLRHPEWSEDPLFSTNQARVIHRQALDLRLQSQILNWDSPLLLEALWQKGIPVGRVHTVSQALASPLAQPLLLEQNQISGLRTNAFHISDFPLLPLSPPPHYGQHTHSTLKNWLHLDDKEIGDHCQQMMIAKNPRFAESQNQ